jgi:FkbM family methyltransferase
MICWAGIARVRRTLTVTTKQGVFTVPTTREESVGKDLYCARQWELGLMRDALATLRALGACPPRGQGTIVDIGANTGVTSIGMLYTGELRRAIAIEPEPRNLALLQQNVRQNGLEERILCLPYAVSDRAGEVVLAVAPRDSGAHHVVADKTPPDEPSDQQVSVHSERLGNLLAALPADRTDDIAVIWIDIEGHEGYVFAGAREYLSQGVPVVSELYPWAMARAGMSPQEYCEIARSIWSSYWVRRGKRFVRYPTLVLDTLFEELGSEPLRLVNVIYTK